MDKETDAGREPEETGFNVTGNLTALSDSPGGDLVREIVELVQERNFPKIAVITDPVGGAAAPVILKPDGTVIGLPAALFDDYLEEPRFRRGTARLTSLDSFIAHVNRFRDSESAVFANDDRTSPSLTAVLDYHPANRKAPSDGTEDGSGDMIVHAPRHMRHRSTFAFPLSDEWKAWNLHNGKKNAMGIGDFAAFLEDRIGDIAAPGELPLSTAAQTYIDRIGGRDRIASPSDLVMLSQGLSINENAAYKDHQRLASGETDFTFTTEHTDSDGRPVTIPTSFQIAIPVFRNGPLYAVVARLRYRVQGGIVFWYELWGVDLTFDDAFSEAADRVRSETGLPVFLGAPEQ